MQPIKTVCVIGSGVMGSAIAAQIANSKTNVILLDIADNKSADKNKIINDSYKKLLNSKPAQLAHPTYAKYIKIGNLEDDISLISNADLVIEVIIEKIDVKHQFYDDISQYLKSTAILSSNTSTIPLSKLKENLPFNIRKNFVIIHFFNPPRYMELVEFITNYRYEDEWVVEGLDYHATSYSYNKDMPYLSGYDGHRIAMDINQANAFISPNLIDISSQILHCDDNILVVCLKYVYNNNLIDS